MEHEKAQVPARYAEIAFPLPVPHRFTYLIPERLRGAVVPGVRVKAPFGPRTLVGYCVRTSDHSDYAKVKPLYAVLDAEPLLDAHMLELARRVSDRYLAGEGEVLEAFLPRGVRKQSRPDTALEASLAIAANAVDAQCEALQARSPRQSALLRALADAGGAIAAAEALRRSRAPMSSLKALAKKGLVTVCETRIEGTAHRGNRTVDADPFELYPEQRAAFELVERALVEGVYRPILLHGVTGSGKTEVYLHAIARARALGRQPPSPRWSPGRRSARCRWRSGPGREASPSSR